MKFSKVASEASVRKKTASQLCLYRERFLAVGWGEKFRVSIGSEKVKWMVGDCSGF